MNARSSFTEKEVADILNQGTIKLQGQFLLGSNYTFLVSVDHAGKVLSAVYKPMRGEQPLWDFPPASLAGREVAAYLVSQALGWGLVPLTILRTGPYGPGSLQQYIDYDPKRHYFTFQLQDRQRLRTVAFFDLLINNADRKGSHVLFQKRTRRLFAIDHGLCFHEDDKLRTVIWDFAGEHIPEELLQDLVKLGSLLDGLLGQALLEHLSMDERAALASRIRRYLDQPYFPMPPKDRRAFPYPPL